MPRSLTNIHDKFVKELLSDKELAIAFLEELLPKALVSLLDLSTLTYEPTSYMTPQLEELFSDVVMRFRLRDGSDCQVSLLLEHKSYIDEQAVVQILRYLAEAYQAQLKAGQKTLTPIIPLLYYHHQKRWQFRQFGELFGELPRDLQAFIPYYQTLFISLNELDEQHLTQLSNSMLSSALLLQRYHTSPEHLAERLSQIISALQPYWEKHFALSILVYLLHVADVPFEQVEQELVQLPTPLKENVMSTYDQILQAGIEKGRAEGIEKGIEKGRAEGIEKGIEKTILNAYDNGVSFDLIQLITGESAEKIKEVLKRNGRA